jgi:hypothetical protein
VISIQLTFPPDVQQVDETGFVWMFLDDAAEPDRVLPGRLLAAGDAEAPFMVRVVDIVVRDRASSIVHLDVLGDPGEFVDELRHAGVLSS